MTDAEIGRRLQLDLGAKVNWSPQAKALYATDSSNYREVPIAVVVPESAHDIEVTLRACREMGAPVLSRGGGTGLAGQTCNVAVVMDMSQKYNRVLSVHPESRTMVVQPGIVLDEARKAVAQYGLIFAPDPATHSRCTLGGMIGNNSCGVHSVMAGKTVDNIVSLEILTYDGLRMTVGPTTDAEYVEIQKQGGRRAEIYRNLRKLAERYQDLIRTRYPHIPRRVSGYNLDWLLPENGFDVARALVGSEGTCVTVLSATLRLVKDPPKKALAVLGFTDLYGAASAVTKVLEHKPIGLEGMDEVLVQDMRNKQIHPDDVKKLPEGNAWLLVELGSDTDQENRARAEALEKDAKRYPGFKDARIVTDPEGQKNLWAVREAGLGATAFQPGQRDTWEGWEDSAVPPEKVADYTRDLRKLYDKYDYEGALYGHFGDGCIHTRINFDLQTADGIKKYHSFVGEAADLVVSYGGSLSGEHGDGQSKAEYLPKMFGPELIQAFEEFKSIWDPLNRMNPGKVVHAHKNTQNLRLGTTYAPADPATHFHFPEDKGSFARAALRCVGVGACRQHTGGVMCPSYQVTREEKHSTRGRAHLLFEMLRGEVIKGGWRSKEVKEALDLCLACKGCKGECPVNVDMATYKAEFLSHYYKGRLRPRHAYAMGQIMRVVRLADLMPWFANFVMQTPGLSGLAKWAAGIHPKRQMPRFASRSFRRRWKKDLREPAYSENAVLLWVDTFTNSFHPEVAESARRVLTDAGFNVVLSKKRYCCGRPLYDFGFLDQARGYLERILRDLKDPIRQGMPIVFLEPSCASVFRDEMKNFFPNDPDAERFCRQSYLLSEFLIKKAPDYRWPKRKGIALVQGHCHHRSIWGFKEEKLAIMHTGMEYQEMSQGCCGMAGSFGFAEEHYEISQQIGAQAVFPSLKEAGGSARVLANGFSCREQIRQENGREVWHLAQLLDPENQKETL